MKLLILLPIIALVLAIVPWLAFSCIDTLFHYKIPYNFNTWVSAVVLIGMFNSK